MKEVLAALFFPLIVVFVLISAMFGLLGGFKDWVDKWLPS